jgi:hypothetical protein
MSPSARDLTERLIARAGLSPDERNFARLLAALNPMVSLPSRTRERELLLMVGEARRAAPGRRLRLADATAVTAARRERPRDACPEDDLFYSECEAAKLGPFDDLDRAQRHRARRRVARAGREPLPRLSAALPRPLRRRPCARRRGAGRPRVRRAAQRCGARAGPSDSEGEGEPGDGEAAGVGRATDRVLDHLALAAVDLEAGVREAHRRAGLPPWRPYRRESMRFTRAKRVGAI